MRLLLLLTVMVIVGCDALIVKEANTIYDKRNEILSIFSNVSIFRTNLGKSIFLYTHMEGKRNDYFFKGKPDAFSLTRDSLSFTPDPVLDIDKNAYSNIEYRKKLYVRLEFYLRKMDSLRITDISSEFSNHGINLKFYLRSKGVMLYVSNIKEIKNPEWQEYVNSFQKLDKNWYYSEQDK